MCRALRFAFLASLLALPLAAAQPAARSPAATDSNALNVLANALFQTVCPQSQPGCNGGCIPQYDNCDAGQYTIEFVRQKPNYVCVYHCTFTQVCHDSVCNPDDFIINTSSFRVRTDPIPPPDTCPAADVGMCTGLPTE